MNNFNPKSIDALLNVVSGKLGVPPEQLKNELESGKFNNALGNMSPGDAQKFQQVLQNPQLMEKFMSAPQAQALYKKLSGEK